MIAIGLLYARPDLREAAQRSVGQLEQLLVALAAGGWAGYQYTQPQPQRDHLRRLGEQRKATACAQVRGAIAETVDLRSSWEREIAKATGFRDFMTTLSRDSFVAAAPDRAREVLA